MTMTEATGRNWLRGKQLALALFATLALAGGAQALTPAPAAAMISEGEECDSSYPSIDCENTGGGGGGESGGGTANPEGGSGDTVGPGEVIEVEGKAPDETSPPSPCGKSCLPSQLGGRHGPGGDGIGQRSPGRHGGKPTKVAKAPKKDDAESGDPSLEDCRALMAGALALSIDSRIQAQSAAATALDERARNLTIQRGLLEIEASGLAVGTVGLEAVRQTIRSVDQQIYEIRMQSFHMGQTLQYLRSERDREKRNLRWECLGRYGSKAVAAG